MHPWQTYAPWPSEEFRAACYVARRLRRLPTRDRLAPALEAYAALKSMPDGGPVAMVRRGRALSALGEYIASARRILADDARRAAANAERADGQAASASRADAVLDSLADESPPGTGVDPRATPGGSGTGSLISTSPSPSLPAPPPLSTIPT